MIEFKINADKQIVFCTIKPSSRIMEANKLARINICDKTKSACRFLLKLLPMFWQADWLKELLNRK